MLPEDHSTPATIWVNYDSPIQLVHASIPRLPPYSQAPSAKLRLTGPISTKPQLPPFTVHSGLPCWSVWSICALASPVTTLKGWSNQDFHRGDLHGKPRVFWELKLLMVQNSGELTTWDGAKNPVKSGIKYQPQLVTTGFLNHQQNQ